MTISPLLSMTTSFYHPPLYQNKMNSIFLNIRSPTIRTYIHSVNFNELKFHTNPIIFSIPIGKSTALVQFSPQCSASASASKPPTSREEAILQAKVSLSSALDKPLNNPKLAAGKLKKIKQPRFRVEIPIIDDSISSLTQLAIEVFGDLPTRRKTPKIKILILWPDQSFAQGAVKAFEDIPSAPVIESIDLSSALDIDSRTLSSADALVFMAPEASKLETIKKVVEILYPKPVVMFNPRWAFEEENNFDEIRSFLGSFDVVYSFMGLEVRGLLSKRKGVIFKCVKDGVVSGEKWNVLVEEGEGLKVVSTSNSRPSITEDNVFVQLICSIQYRIIKANADDAFYELQYPKEQIQAYVFDVVRAHVPRMTLDALFEQKSDVAQAVLEELEKVMGAYGYNIEQILVVDIIPDPSVRKAMNEINAAQRLQLASVYKGEAEKILQIKRAEAEAESKYLGGVGVARQRQAITDGLRENILNFSHKVEGTSSKEVMDLIMITQYFDTIKDLGNSSSNTTVFIPHGPGHVRDIGDQIRNGLMEASSAQITSNDQGQNLNMD